MSKVLMWVDVPALKDRIIPIDELMEIAISELRSKTQPIRPRLDSGFKPFCGVCPNPNCECKEPAYV